MSLVSLDARNVFPLSAAQERLWYAHTLDGDSDQYNVPIALEIRSRLNVPALSQAFHRLLARHDNMRAVFTERDSKPVQVIPPASWLAGWLRIVDLSGLGPDRDGVATHVQALESTATFKLDTAPLLRVTLLRLEEERHVIMVSSHHILLDGASLRILLEEVASAYERYARGETDGLVPLTHQYADYVSWENGYLASRDAEKSAEFWTQYLSGAPAHIGLPSDYALASAMQYAGRECEHLLGAAVSREIRLHAQRAQCTDFMLLLAALGALIHRYTGRPDLVIATGSEGRHRPEWSQLIGFFVNLLPIRMGVHGRMTFDDLLYATRDSALRALEHAKYPFINILKDATLNRNVHETPYCDVVFEKMDAVRSAVANVPLEWSDISAPGHTAKFNMLLHAVDEGRSIKLICEYNGRLYCEERITRFLRQYERLLKQALANPTAEIASYQILEDAERREIVNAWNRTAAALPAAADVSSLVEIQARETPDRIAVADADEQVSYRRLMADVDALAERLSAWTDRSEFVGVLLERSIRFVVAILAINRIGKAFVPIDASLPESRVDYILKDAGVTVLITSRHLKDRTATLSAIGKIVCVDQPEAVASPAASGKVGVERRSMLRPNACCLYPSGATGAPKGVVISQTALCNYLWWAGARYRLRDAVVALHSSLSADLAITSILGPLVSGGTTRVYRDAQDGNLLEHILREKAVDVLRATPTQLAPLDVSGTPARRLRTLIIGGERLPLSLSLAERTRQILNPDLTIYNEYGRTEVTVGCVVYEYRGDEWSANSVPIGRPIANMEAYVLDDRLNPVPRGVKGEIYLSGVGLAARYHNSPSLTAERFLPNPFRARQRMYRTGDIGVLHFNGELEFSDGADRQIDVRGSRVALEERPLTRSGRVDRARLPNVDQVRPELRVKYVPPGGPIEEDLAEIWSRLLCVDDVGVEDDFFALGGHSLLALYLVRRVAQVFRVDIELNTVIANSTIAALARIIEHAKPTEASHGLGQIVPDPDHAHDPFPLTETQEAYWVGRKTTSEMGNVGLHGYLEVTCRNLSLHRVEQAWTRLVARHGMLRAIIQEDATQRILADVHCEPFPIIDLRGVPSVAFEAIIQRVRDGMSHEVRPPDRWPLFDIRVVLKSDNEACVLMSLEVMNVDESSFLILYDELGQLYQEPDARMAPLSLSFRDYVIGQRDLVPPALIEQSWEYWNAVLDDLPPGPELPTAISLKEVVSPRFTRRTFSVEPARWRAVQRFARRIKVTPSGLLLAVYAEVLARWSNSSRFTISIPVYNRLPLHPKVNDLVGVFTAIELLVVEVPPNTGFAQRAVQIQQRLWRDLDHRFVSGVKLLREIGRRRRANSEAAFPYVFTNIMGLGRSGRTSGVERIGEITYAISQTPQVLLDCQLSEEADGLLACWDSVDEVFPPGMLDEMFRAFEGMVHALGSGQADIDASIEEAIFPTHRRAEREAINRTETTVRESTVPADFVTQARTTARHAAVIARQREISYEELHGMAEALAASLFKKGAAANELIAICVEKGWPQIVAVWGVLLSGAAYLPIEPSVPADRIRLYLRHGRVRVLVTESHLAETLGDVGVQVVTLDRLLSTERDATPRLRAPSCRPEDLCYMLYTSGSTGEPKGVMVEHRSVINRMADIAARFALGPADRTIAITSLQHDLSVFDMFGPLLTGGAVVVPDSPRALDPAHWTELIADRKVTIWNSVPAFMEIMVGYLESRSEAADLRSLRLILLSGDRIPPKLYVRIRRAIPHAQVVSLGGPTEVTVWDIGHPLHDVASDIKRIPYGYPLANSQCYVLDEELRDCPTWVTGNLYSSGIGLARGYWDDEALTRTSFITHPKTGARMYLTGDLARYLPDGSIDIIGRRDFQVKVNGYRVECEEIEALLNKHPRVTRSAVTTFQHPSGGHALVAYVVPNGSDTPAKTAGGAVAGAQLDQLQFRLSQPGIRRFGGDRKLVSLRESGASDDAEIRPFLSRRSYRRFQARSIPRHELAQLLGCLRQIRIDDTPFPKYRYGSAGNLYPVQTYVYVRPRAITDVKGGLYYYDPVGHGLVLLGELKAFPVESVGAVNRPLLEAASFILFLIADLDAIRPLYAEASLRYCAIEAGLIAQLLEMSCAGTTIGLTQIGSIQIDALKEHFQLGPSHELIHALVGGSVVREDSIDAYKKDVVETPSTAMAQPVALPTELECYLESKLSRAVVPRRFVMLDALPLTRNGKVDRDALPAPESIPAQGAVVYQAPQTDIEKALVEIWQALLGVEQVGIQDNFFDLGGNSLLLIKANREILERLRLEISIVEMFYHPTIQSMAGHLLSKSAPARAPAGVPEESVRVKRRKNRGK